MSKTFITFVAVGATLLLLSGCGADKTGTAPSSKLVSTQASTQVKPARMKCVVTFKNMESGDRSEMYLNATTSQGAQVKATVDGPGVMDNKQGQEVTGTADESGNAKITWNINQPGTYHVVANSTMDGQAAETCELMAEAK